MAVAQSPSDGSTICYVLPVLMMTSYFNITEGTDPNQRQHVCFIQFARWRHGATMPFPTASSSEYGSTLTMNGIKLTIQ